MKQRIGLITLSLLLTPAAMAGGSGGQPVIKPTNPASKPAACQSIAQIVASDPQFSTLLTAVQSAGLVETLNNKGSYTVFAPSNTAFAKVPSDKLADTLNDSKMLSELLLYHVVNEAATAQDIRASSSGTTMQGEDIKIAVMGNKLMINNAAVTKADLRACNGYVHVIDTVLMPPASKVAAAPAPAAGITLSTPASTPAPASSTTVTAPAAPSAAVQSTDTAAASTTDSSSAAATSTTQDQTTTAQSTAQSTTQSTISTTNTSIASTEFTISNMDMASKNNGELVQTEANFSTLRDLLVKANLADTLSSGEYTIFAPNNDAFAALPEGLMDKIAQDPELLKTLLTYHVVKGKVASEDILSNAELTTLQGGTLQLENAYPQTSYTTKNGMVYVVDNVLFPGDFKMPDLPPVP